MHYREGSDSIPGQYTWDLGCTKRRWGRFSCKCFGVICQLFSYYRRSISIHRSSGVSTLGSLEITVPRTIAGEKNATVPGNL